METLALAAAGPDEIRNREQAQMYEVNTGDAALEFICRFDPDARQIT